MSDYRFVGFFFFEQKTAYEVRISDWSSDVCSSDLPSARRRRALGRNRSQRQGGLLVARQTNNGTQHGSGEHGVRAFVFPGQGSQSVGMGRSEERRVGKSVSVRVARGGRRIIKYKNRI